METTPNLNQNQIVPQAAGFEMPQPVQLDNPLAADVARAQKEVEGAIILAKKFPRNEDQAHKRILNACKRSGLAESAMYSYPRGGTKVTGPSIRLAELLAQHWGNLQYGIREISQNESESTVETFAWDLETNVRAVRQFTQPHARYSKNNGLSQLQDPRDKYEIVANFGARRLRACLLEVIPGDIVEAAVKQCEATLRGNGGENFDDRRRKMIMAFDSINVTESMIENHLRHKIEAIDVNEMVALQKIYTSIKDGYSKREDYFELNAESLADSLGIDPKGGGGHSEPVSAGAETPSEDGGVVDDNTVIQSSSDDGQQPPEQVAGHSGKGKNSPKRSPAKPRKSAGAKLAEQATAKLKGSEK